MTQPFTIRLADERDFQKAVTEQVRYFTTVLKSPEVFLSEVEKECEKGISYKNAWENVEERIEKATGLRHYGDYTSFRVQKHRIQSKMLKSNQLSLFENR